MSGTILSFQRVRPEDLPQGVVAMVRLPLPVQALRQLDRFIAAAYGRGAVCREEPQGWLEVSVDREHKP